MNRILEMQSSFCSVRGTGEFCSYDQEVIDGSMAPLLHRVARFWLVEQGKGRARIQEREYTLKAGTLVSVLPWQITEILQVEEPLYFHLLAYNFDGVNRIIKTLYNVENIHLSLSREMEQFPVMDCSPEESEVFRQILLRIRSQGGFDSFSSQEDYVFTPYLANQTVSMVFEFLRLIQLKGKPDDTRAGIRKSDIFPYIFGHLGQKLTLEHLSKLFYMSESTISDYITRTTGLSFFDLLNEMRIGRTMDFLTYTDLTLEELSEILGFVDSAHISRVFAARTGMKASEYRKLFRGSREMSRLLPDAQSYQVIMYIYRHFAENLTAREVAAGFGMTYKELNQILLYQVEKNFMDFLNFVRVNRASQILVNTDATILETALEVGYSNEKTLTRYFLRFRMMTPGHFRAQVKGQDL